MGKDLRWKGTQAEGRWHVCSFRCKSSLNTFRKVRTKFCTLFISFKKSQVKQSKVFASTVQN